jgi:hypothetical protein
MKNLITNKYKNVIELHKADFITNDSLSAYEKISKEYDSLIKKGLITKRGNNLMTLEEKRFHNYSIISNK